MQQAAKLERVEFFMPDPPAYHLSSVARGGASRPLTQAISRLASATYILLNHASVNQSDEPRVPFKSMQRAGDSPVIAGLSSEFLRWDACTRVETRPSRGTSLPGVVICCDGFEGDGRVSSVSTVFFFDQYCRRYDTP